MCEIRGETEKGTKRTRRDGGRANNRDVGNEEVGRKTGGTVKKRNRGRHTRWEGGREGAEGD